MEFQRNVLLISPAYLRSRYTLPPPGIGYIASSLEGIGCQVRFIDCQITSNYKRKVLSLLPDYPTVGISVTAGTVSSALDIAKAIRIFSPQTKIIMGGPQATAVYEKLIPEYADIVVRGEGEDTIVELMQQKDLSNIRGIAYWNKELKVNPSRPYIEDLDRLRFPAWHLYKQEKYKFSSCRTPLAFVITSRGCPYDCIHCTKFVHGYKVRVRSIDNVMNEINYMVSELSIKEILIADDLFTYNVDRVKELCKRIIACRYIDLRFLLTGGIRPDFDNQEIFNLLAEAGFYFLGIGVETASQEVADKLGRSLDINKLRNNISMARKAGLKVVLYFMLGLPFDTKETMRETIDLAKNLSADGATFLFTIPFAGTKLCKMVHEKGRFLVDLNLNSICYEANPVYEIGQLKAKDVKTMFKLAHREFYLRPANIYNAVSALSKVKSPKIAMGLIKDAVRKLIMSW